MLTNREIKKILKRMDKDRGKHCANGCKKYKYNIKDVECNAVHLLHWLAEHDEVIEKLKGTEEENKENKENKEENKEESKLKNKDIYKTPEERIKAFEKFCDYSYGACTGCILDERRAAGNQYCIFYWLEMEHNPGDQIAIELVEKIKKSCSSNNNYSFIKELFSTKHRDEIKAIWAKQDEENNNGK